MSRVIYYKNKDEWKNRATKLKAKESFIHDDFIDKDGHATDGNSGKLTIDIISNVIDPKSVRQKELRKKLKDNSINFEELKEMLRG